MCQFQSSNRSISSETILKKGFKCKILNLSFNMSFPCLYMVPHWLEISIGVNWALSIVLCLWENGSSDGLMLNLLRMTSYGGKPGNPFVCLARPKNVGCSWEHELGSTKARARFEFSLERHHGLQKGELKHGRQLISVRMYNWTQ